MNKTRPTLPTRYEIIVQLNLSIQRLKRLIEKYNDPDLYEEFELQIKLRDFLMVHEEIYRLEELEEAYNNLGKYPHAVRTWLLFYREKEMATYDDEDLA